MLGRPPGVPLTLAPRPETLGLARPAPGAAADAARRPRAAAADRQVLARPFIDVDVAGPGRAGLLGEANAQAEGGANVIRDRARAPSPSAACGCVGPHPRRRVGPALDQLGFGQALVDRRGAWPRRPGSATSRVPLRRRCAWATTARWPWSATPTWPPTSPATRAWSAPTASSPSWPSPGWRQPAVNRAVVVHIPADADSTRRCSPWRSALATSATARPSGSCRPTCCPTPCRPTEGERPVASLAPARRRPPTSPRCAAPLDGRPRQRRRPRQRAGRRAPAARLAAVLPADEHGHRHPRRRRAAPTSTGSPPARPPSPGLSRCPTSSASR